MENSGLFGRTPDEWEEFHFMGEANPYTLEQPKGSLRVAYKEVFDLVEEADKVNKQFPRGYDSGEGVLYIANHGVLPVRGGPIKYDVFTFFGDSGYGKFSVFSSGHVTRTQYEGRKARMLYTRAATQDDIRDLEMILRIQPK